MPEPPASMDDVLFFPPGEKVPAKSAGNGKRWIAVGIVLLVVIAAAAIFVLPMLTGKGGPSPALGAVPATTTPVPEPVASLTTVPTPAETPAPTPKVSNALVPQPTQVLPGGQKVYFQVQKDPVSGKISVRYEGSTVANSVTSADITITQPGGAVTTGIILPLKGVTELTLAGSKGADRVEILARMTNGQTYRIFDQLLSLRG